MFSGNSQLLEKKDQEKDSQDEEFFEKDLLPSANDSENQVEGEQHDTHEEKQELDDDRHFFFFVMLSVSIVTIINLVLSFFMYRVIFAANLILVILASLLTAASYFEKKLDSREYFSLEFEEEYLAEQWI